MNNIINFKGVKDGIILQISEKVDFEAVKDAIHLKSQGKTTLLKNSNLVGIVGMSLSYKEKAILEELLSKLLEINVLSLEEFSYNNNISDSPEDEVSDITDCSDNMDTVFIENTLRSGKEINSEGHIIVLGDVNPGAILKAKGNIVVLGKLRGIAHAGIDGNDDAFISANKLIPNQLRISDIISRAPDHEDNIDNMVPEKASINNGRIVIERF